MPPTFGILHDNLAISADTSAQPVSSNRDGKLAVRLPATMLVKTNDALSQSSYP